MSLRPILAVAVMGISLPAFAESYLVSQCKKMVADFDRQQILGLQLHNDYKKLVVANKVDASTAVERAQATFEEMVVKIYSSAPDIKIYVSEKNALTAAQKASGLARVLAPLLYSQSTQQYLSTVATQLVSDGAVRYAESQQGSLFADKIYDINELKLRVHVSSYLYELNDTVTLFIATSAFAEGAPRNGTMTQGMKFVNLESGAEVLSIQKPSNWGGPLTKMKLTEPFSDWESGAQSVIRGDETQEIRACRNRIRLVD